RADPADDATNAAHVLLGAAGLCADGAPTASQRLAASSSSTRNHAAYSAGRNSSVSAVATISPPMMATAIGPKNTLRDSGIIASTAASAGSTRGRKRRTVAARIGVQRHWAAPVAWSI